MVVLLNLQQGIFMLNIHFIMYQVVNDSILLIFRNKALAFTVLYHRRIGPARIVHGAGNPEQRITQGRVKNPIFHSLPKFCPNIDRGTGSDSSVSAWNVTATSSSDSTTPSRYHS